MSEIRCCENDTLIHIHLMDEDTGKQMHSMLLCQDCAMRLVNKPTDTLEPHQAVIAEKVKVAVLRLFSTGEGELLQ